MISYKNIQDSIEFYESKGFKRIESPWMITEDISNITKPKGCDDFRILRRSRGDKVLVASGEQSFLYLYNKGFLPKGSFQTVTPCFRQEVITRTHYKYFIKNELIETENVTVQRLNEIIKTAKEFFESILDDEVEEILSVNGNTDGKIQYHIDNVYDLQYKGIELGSYGIRHCEFLKWIFATGCAEPRLSYCQNLLKNY